MRGVGWPTLITSQIFKFEFPMYILPSVDPLKLKFWSIKIGHFKDNIQK